MFRSTSSTPGFSAAWVIRPAASPLNSAASASRDAASIRLPGFTRIASVSPIVTATAVVNM